MESPAEVSLGFSFVPPLCHEKSEFSCQPVHVPMGLIDPDYTSDSPASPRRSTRHTVVNPNSTRSR